MTVLNALMFLFLFLNSPFIVHHQFSQYKNCSMQVSPSFFSLLFIKAEGLWLRDSLIVRSRLEKCPKSHAQLLMEQLYINCSAHLTEMQWIHLGEYENLSLQKEMEVVPSKLPLQDSPLPFVNITHVGKRAAWSSTQRWMSLMVGRRHSISGWEFRLRNSTSMNLNPSSVTYKLIRPYTFKL